MRATRDLLFCLLSPDPPASAALVGYESVSVPSNTQCMVDLVCAADAPWNGQSAVFNPRMAQVETGSCQDTGPRICFLNFLRCVMLGSVFEDVGLSEHRRLHRSLSAN